MRAYAVGWIVLVIAALVMIAREPRLYLSGAYGRFLLEPWRFATFAIGGAFFTLAAPYTGDPTWDHADGAMMSVLTYLTAPWSVGALARAAKGTLVRRAAFVAIVLWMLSASWSYDAYLWWRDGSYPRSWLGNLCASSVLYVCGGLFWNVVYDKGITFAFLRDDWFARGELRWRMFALGAVFAAIVVGMMVPFFLR